MVILQWVFLLTGCPSLNGAVEMLSWKEILLFLSVHPRLYISAISPVSINSLKSTVSYTSVAILNSIKSMDGSRRGHRGHMPPPNQWLAEMVGSGRFC